MKKELIAALIGFVIIAGVVIAGMKISNIFRENRELIATRIAIHEASDLAQIDSGRMIVFSVQGKHGDARTCVCDIFPNGKSVHYTVGHDGSIDEAEYQDLGQGRKELLRDTTFTWNDVEKFE